jgi:hypothetical protein
LRGSCDPAHHEPDHGQLNKGKMRAGERLEVLSQPTASVEPRDGPFDAPLDNVA